MKLLQSEKVKTRKGAYFGHGDNENKRGTQN